ncbi:MAG TPA: hypothetical protein VMC80_02815 [Patescibacteria group bacterium]|nr:hypothetical protein [Patescibacteria group bacterium]
MNDMNGLRVIEGFYVDNLGRIYYHVKEIGNNSFVKRTLAHDYTPLESARGLIRLTFPGTLFELMDSVEKSGHSIL